MRRGTEAGTPPGAGYSAADTDADTANSMYTAWSHLSDLSKRLLLVGTGLMFMAAAALGLMLWWLHRNAIVEARDNISALGTAISEQTSRSLQAGDLVLEDLRRQIANQRLRSVAEFKTRLATEDMFHFLKDRSEFLPQVDAFTIIAADGKLVNYSRQWPVPPTDLADRDYIAYFRTHDATTTFISGPVQNRGNGVWTSYMVRRVDSSTGQFLGLVLAALDLDYFRDFYKALRGAGGTTVTLLNRNGTALTSYPPTAKIGDVLPETSPWYSIVRSGPEVFETRGILAPGDRIVSVHPLRDYPLVINVSVAKDGILANWTRIALVTGLSTIMAITCVLLLIRAQLMQFQRLERSEALLANRNFALERTQTRLQQQAEELTVSRSSLTEQSGALRAALAHMNQGILMAGADGRVVVCNAQAMAMLDLPASLMAARPSFDAVINYQENHGEFNDPSANIRAGSFERAMTGLRRYERVRPNGTILDIQTVPMQGGGLVRTYTDITERRRSEQQVRHLARHDPLTSLLNRTAFREEFDTLIGNAAAARQGLAVFYMDLDGFKLVNDTHGHAVGDELLIAVAGRLRSAVRTSDVVVRMGGDEFAVIQPLAGIELAVPELAHRILSVVSDIYRIGDAKCTIGLSIGGAIYPDHSTESSELLQCADTALYRAKASGKRAFCLFDPALDRGPQSPLALEQDLAVALVQQQFSLEYQPIVDSMSLEVVRFEALLRWRHPERGAVSPAAFIPVAERSGLIVPIGAWVLETACTAAAGWPWPVEVSVNLSPVQFARGGVAAQIEDILSRTGLPPWRLNLEITEGVLLENTITVTNAMAALRKLGVRFSLDDFGTAHAGLTYLRGFSFDVLKIDRSFVNDAVRTPEARGILGAIQAIGAACNMQVVAEGVETEAELALVRDLRCDCVQGYFTGRPSPHVTIENTGAAEPVSARPSRLSLVAPS